MDKKVVKSNSSISTLESVANSWSIGVGLALVILFTMRVRDAVIVIVHKLI